MTNKIDSLREVTWRGSCSGWKWQSSANHGQVTVFCHEFDTLIKDWNEKFSSNYKKVYGLPRSLGFHA
jgi:hypothetical protein